MKSLEELDIIVKERLSEERYLHTKSVEKLASELAEKYSINKAKAATAAILHDVTKEVCIDNQLQMVKKSGIICDELFLNCKNLYHAFTGFLYARDVLGIQDEEILDAIRYHTTGRANMTMLEKIVYVADAVGYDRDYQDITRLRDLAFEDIDMCVIEILKFTMSKLARKNLLISEETISCYNYLLLNK